MIFLKFLKKFRRILRLGPLPVLFWALVLNITFGVCFYLAERRVQENLTLEDSLWWSMVTMATVGYGDFYAKTTIGRFLISYPCMFLGIGVIGYLVGLVANSLFDWTTRIRRGALQIRLKNHIIICHFPNEDKILSLVRELHSIPQYMHTPCVLISDRITELPDKLVKAGLHFVFGATNDEATLYKANILECEGVILLAREPHEVASDDRAYTTGSLIELISKDHQKEVKTIVELVSARSLRTMARTHVDGTVTIDGISSALLAQEFLNPGMSKVINQMITTAYEDQLFFRKLKGNRSVLELRQMLLNHQLSCQILGYLSEGQPVLNPPLKDVVGPNQSLVILAKDAQDFQTLDQILTKESL